MITGHHSDYYEFHHGSWRGDFVFKIDDWQLFWAARISLLDRCRLLSMAMLTKFFGHLSMETSVDCDTLSIEGRVVHSTRLVKLGMTLFLGRECLTLHEDGCSAQMILEQRMWPSLGHVRRFEDGRVVVDESARAATYDMPWFGERMTQKTRVVPDGLEVLQQTPWSTASTLLRRVSKGAP